MSNVKVKISLVMLLAVLFSFTVSFAAELEYVRVDYSLTYNGTAINNGAVLTDARAGDKVVFTAKCNDEGSKYWSTNTTFMSNKGFVFNNEGMAFLAYAFDSKNLADFKTADKPTTVTITIPNYEAGSTHILRMQGIAAIDGLVENGKEKQATTGTVAIKFTMANKDQAVAEEKLNMEVRTNTEKTVTEVTPKITNGTFVKFTYNWDKEKAVDSTKNPLRLDVPQTQGDHILYVTLTSKSGKTVKAEYKFTIAPKAPENDDLEVEDWMKENNELEVLAVSLRNGSDDEKGNDNFYALDEEVIYYVDYKNGGSDIKKEVTLRLELPLEFEVINSYGGTVDESKKTITWEFPNGLEEDQAGTKIVRLKYTSLGRSKKYNIIYPIAKILKSGKVSDESTVINYIYKNTETVMSDEHYPYMFGDKNKDTFRPDDSITRAEGALVLTRILGINTSGTIVGNEYKDLDDTYIEAQKAIVAATKLGVINGYEDGTYRPNKKMTKAEFMKIIASYIEVNAENDNIKGLEIKAEDELIKVYKNPINTYVTGTTTTSKHWALNWVTLLARLNMTGVSEKNRNLGLDQEITRAEVAQLCNLYLFRAPASNGKSTFSDVSKNHKLYKDIIEATRVAHTYSISEDAYEVAEKEK